MNKKTIKMNIYYSILYAYVLLVVVCLTHTAYTFLSVSMRFPKTTQSTNDNNHGLQNCAKGPKCTQ